MINKDLAERTRYFKETEEGVSVVCAVMEEMRAEKERETRIDDIKRIMRTLKLTIEQAMDALEIPVAERGIYTSRISNV